MILTKPRVSTVLTLCLVLLTTPLQPLRAAAQEPDLIDFRPLVLKLFAAFQREAPEEFFSLWSEKSPELAASKQRLQQAFADYQQIEVKNIELRPVSVEPQQAQLLVQAELSALRAGTRRPATDLGLISYTLKLVKEAGQWKVWRFASSEEDLMSELLAAPTAEARKALLAARPQLLTPRLVAVMYKRGKLLSDRGEVKDALGLYDLALGVAEQLHDDGGAAITLRLTGNVYLSRGDYAQARGFYQRSLDITNRLQDRGGSASTLTNMGVIFKRQGNYQQALSYYQESLKIQTELQDQSATRTALNNIGIVYGMQDDFTQAQDYFERSLKLAQELGDKKGVAETLVNLGVLYTAQGNYAQGLAYYYKSLRLETELQNQAAVANALANIGNIHLKQGNFQQALVYLQRSLRLQEQVEYNDLTPATLTSLGDIYQVLEDFPRALAYYQRGLKLAEQMEDKDTVAMTLSKFGVNYFLQGQYAAALDYFRKSLKLYEELGSKEDVAYILGSIGETYLKLNDYAAALDATRRASELSAQSAALADLWQIRNTEGKAYLALMRYEPARQDFLASIAVIEQLRGQVAGGELERVSFFEDKLEPYQSMVELSLAQHDYEQALAFAERAKGRVLLEVLNSGRVNIDKAMSQGESERERALTADLRSLNTQILNLEQQTSPDQARLAELREQLDKARLAYESFQTELYAAHPELKVRRGEATPLNLNEVAELLPNDKTALLEYVVMQDQAYLFVITKAVTAEQTSAPVSITVYPLNVKRVALAGLVADFRQRVADRNLSIKNAGRQLYDLLLKPARQQLQGLDKLCIVPDGSLWDLPFQALLTTEGRYLLEDYTLFYVPSLNVSREMMKRGSDLRARAQMPSGDTLRREPNARPDAGGPELLALGNPVLNRGTVQSVGSVYRQEGFEPLPEAEREVNTLRQIYGRARSKVLTRSAAREEVIKSEASRYSVLHFATHAILDDRNPMYSRIMFAQAGRSAAEDGMLEAWEIMKLDLAAELVVLSACQTARGRVGAGEGMVGMSWALFVAGAPSVLVSQWKVDSARTADLMINFHRNLMSKRPGGKPAFTKSEALREAALSLLRGPYNHPTYWAGFVLIGDER
jgi:CHAT domain-containing protein/Tfp pilus assembly protein PilF